MLFFGVLAHFLEDLLIFFDIICRMNEKKQKNYEKY